MRELENYLGMELDKAIGLLQDSGVEHHVRVVPCPNPRFELHERALRVVRLREIDDTVEVVAMPEQKAPSQ